jgi:hypothetical protein
LALPTFLGIGVQRGGTTWLHELLTSHPDIYVPTRRKEIHFFTLYYERGLSWYEDFFPPDEQTQQYRAIGEISPSYFYLDDFERITTIPSINKFILMLRNPVSRAYSQYGLHVRDQNYSGTFEDFLKNDPYSAIQDGFYNQRLETYLRYFNREQILVLIQEQAFANIPQTKQTIAQFLDVLVERFPPNAGIATINRSYIPKRSAAYALAFSISRYLREQDLDGVVNFAKRRGLKRLFGEKGSLPPMKAETQQYLKQLFTDDIKKLELLLQMDLKCWQ